VNEVDIFPEYWIPSMKKSIFFEYWVVAQLGNRLLEKHRQERKKPRRMGSVRNFDAERRSYRNDFVRSDVAR
jgi:hypothetical protein